MSFSPEEIPVAFTTFMALGSWRLMKEGVIVKKRTVESLGSATIICTDKTGTLTENKMSLNPYTL
jgi:Ca2+-transporting ATPase